MVDSSAGRTHAAGSTVSGAGSADERAPTATPCAGAIVFDDDRRLLVIRRGHAPSAGLWSIPGGRAWTGEESHDTCVREAREETGLDVEVVRFAGRVELAAPSGVYVVDDFVCRPVGGALAAGDDAVDARWVTRAELESLDAAGALSPGLCDALGRWDALPR